MTNDSESAQAAETERPWRCPRCGSARWVRASLTRGMTVIPQCIPCGHYDGQHRVTPDGALRTTTGQSA